jgi:restriction system protein
MSVPKYDDLFNPLLKTMKELGSSATISELDEAVMKRLRLTDKEIAEQHGDSNKTELQYRLSWARTYLKAYGLLDNSERGIWVLSPKGKQVTL